MKNLIKFTFMIALVAITYYYRNNIATFINDNIIYRGSNKVLTYNEYYINNDYYYVQNIESNKANNYQEILNIIYTIINSGDDSYSFKCNYKTCLDDVKRIIADDTIFSNINNFVHPYNSFSSINVDLVSNGTVTITVKKLYTEEQITFINGYINDFIKDNVEEDQSIEEKIKLFHDYIIENTIYDEELKESYTAYSLITTGKSICGGYSDIMAIYLNNLGIKNYKITSLNHVWNLVDVNGKWLHLDLTWDDPVASDGNQYLIYEYFLISTDELLNLDIVEHDFDKNVFIEAK